MTRTQADRTADLVLELIRIRRQLDAVRTLAETNTGDFLAVSLLRDTLREHPATPPQEDH